ncbi:MAG: DnaJ domain-containing protein [Deltaproteobacteria bacterium]|nr:DnaJ domain-containing protein [Deltaproteobacteria bacterium]
MTRKQALGLLGLKEGASPEEIKRSYRKLAFALHPDLHPDMPDAGKEFQRVNEAYVFLTSLEAEDSRSAPRGKSRAAEKAEATEKARSEAQRAYAKAKKRFQEEAERDGPRPAAESASPQGGEGGSRREMNRDEVLRDLLRDPFARRVFEDIYSQIRDEAARKQGSGGAPRRPGGLGVPPAAPGFLGKTADNVSGWLRRQIDEEQTVRFAGPLAPGKRIRLQIHHGVFGKPRTIEMTLPPEFEPGRPIRLKGLGKRIGKWRGDLYLRILEL